RLESRIREKKWRQCRREAAESMRNERPVIRKSNRKHSRHDQDDERQSEQRAHPNLNPPEPPHARDVNRIEEDETGDRNRQRRSAAAEQLDEVVAKSKREIRQRADIRNDLQPDADKRRPIPAERARKMRVLPTRLPPQRRRQKDRVSNRRGQNRWGEQQITKDDTRPDRKSVV